MTKKILKEYAEWVRENNLIKDFMIGLAVALSFFCTTTISRNKRIFVSTTHNGYIHAHIYISMFFYYNYPTLLRSIVSSWERRREKIEGGYTLQ